MANQITYTDKNTGDTFTAANANEIKNQHNALDTDVTNIDLSSEAFGAAITFDKNKYIGSYSLSSGALSLTLAASGNVAFRSVYFQLIADGVNTTTVSSDFEILNSSLTSGEVLTLGVYKCFLFYDGTKVMLNLMTSSLDLNVPTVSSATVEDGAESDIVVVFNEAVTLTNVGWSFAMDAAGLTINSIAGSGTSTITFTIAETITEGAVVTRIYDSGTGDTLDASSNELVSFTDQSVTNNVVDAWAVSDLGAKLELYLDAAIAEGTVEVTGSDVTNWNDASGNNYDATPVSTPQYNGSTLVTTNGSSTYFTVGGLFTAVSAAVKGSITFVVQDATTQVQMLTFARSGANSTYVLMAGIHSTSKARIYWNNGGTANDIRSTNNVSVGSVVTVESTGTAYKIYIDGVEETLVVATGSDNGNWIADVTSLNNCSMGAQISNSPLYYASTYSSLIYCNDNLIQSEYEGLNTLFG